MNSQTDRSPEATAERIGSRKIRAAAQSCKESLSSSEEAVCC